MMRDRFVRAMLLVIAVLLLINLCKQPIISFISSDAMAEVQRFSYRGNGVGIACSGDGRYVYAAGTGIILRSTDFGKPDSWEMVVD